MTDANSLTPAIKAEVEKAKSHIDKFRWLHARFYSKLKNGASFVCPVERGVWKTNLVIQIRDDKLDKIIVDSWRRYE
jgi:hypothetical protein